MIDYPWETAEATIVDLRIIDPAPGHPGHSENAIHEFVVDVRRSGGPVFRTTLKDDTMMASPVIGDVLRVEVDNQQHVRMDRSPPPAPDAVQGGERSRVDREGDPPADAE